MRTDQPLVSVCIGSYNRERYIRETLDSVFAQTYPNLEVIVVDDASTDGTVGIIKSYGDRVKLIEREINSGMCPVTRNEACRAATGSYVALLDSDDCWYPTKIEKQVAFLESRMEIPMCHTYCHIIDEASQVKGVRHQGRLPPTGRIFEKLLRHCFITISSVMVRRSIFDEVGWFIEDQRYGIWGEDLDFFLRVARAHPIGLVAEREVLARYRRAESNISAGNWKCTPESVPMHRMVIERPDLWQGVCPRREVVGAFIENSLENCQYWRDRGYADRALWFAWHALMFAPVRPQVWTHLAKSAARRVLPRRGRR